MSEAGSVERSAPIVLPRSVAVGRGTTEPLSLGSWANRNLPRLGLLATPWRSRRAARRAAAAARVAEHYDTLSETAFDAERRAVGRRLRRDGLAGTALTDALALAAVAAKRTLGLKPYPGQLAAAASLAGGEVVEMDTGEGKTLAALLGAATCALAGRVVHVVTANDYLAERDGAALRPALERLGLSVGIIVGQTQTAARREAYAADICFLSGKEVAFDYLRDGLVRGRTSRDRNTAAKLSRTLGDAGGPKPLQRGLDVAIIDEIDSVLIDEAGTPLIISAEEMGDVDPAAARDTLGLAGRLLPGRHYRFASSGPMPDLTREGVDEVERWAQGRSGIWSIRLRREEVVRAAIAASQRLVRDRDYLVRDGKVEIVDPHSGRVMADRQWGHDLHAAVETKEGLGSTKRRKSLASISFQRFFRSYRLVSGMSGTVREIAGELATVYGLQLTRVSRRLPLRRRWSGRRIFVDRERLWSEIGDEVARRHVSGQPVIVAVRSVGESTRAADALAGREIPFRLLNAAQDRQEAEIVAGAGLRGAVTVVTNMAGRGTDIRLGPDVAALGGLAVMICERHESRRVDRQLMGRAARQGDPGEVAEFVSAQDDILSGLGLVWRTILRHPVGRRLLAGQAFRQIQLRTERSQARDRFDLVRRDEDHARTLAFAGGLD